MEKESELEKRRRQLREQKEALMGLQASRVPKTPQPPAQTFSAPSTSGQGSADRRRRANSAFGNGFPKPKSSIEHTVFAGVDVAPTRTLVSETKAQVLDEPTTAEMPTQFNELFGEEGYFPDYENITLAPEEPVDDDGLRVDGVYNANTAGGKDAPLSFQFCFHDADCSEKRTVNAIKFHKKIDDVVLSAHGARSDNRLGLPDGTVGIWTLHGGKGTLQRSLTATASVTALELPSLSPALVIGGTWGGSVLMWDTRVRTALPINAFSQNVEDSHNNHGRHSISAIKTTASPSPLFISMSTNGHACKWTLSKPDRPISRGLLQDSSNTAELAVSCMDFPRSARLFAEQRTAANRSTSFFTGCLDGGLCRIDENGSSWSLDTGHGSHDAPVTAISAHPFGHRVPYLDDVIASSSRDWTIRLWRFRRGQPCEELQSRDMVAGGAVHDVQWSTQHPTVFCAGDDSGALSLFDVSGQLSSEGTRQQWQFTPKSTAVRRPAINRVQWSTNSRNICTGDEQGNLSIWTCNSTFAALPDADWMVQYLKATSSHDP